MNIEIRKLETEADVRIWKDAFAAQRIERPESYYSRCFEENGNGLRVTLLAFADGELAGVVHLKRESDYPYFRERGIPEVNDLNVFPAFRRRGIANRMLETFENIAAGREGRIGIGVGLFRAYGAAQRIYCRRGYIPDGNGVMYENAEVAPGETVRVDDDLNLYFVKELRQSEEAKK